MGMLICEKLRTTCRGRQSGTCACKSCKQDEEGCGLQCGWYCSRWDIPQCLQIPCQNCSSRSVLLQLWLHSDRKRKLATFLACWSCWLQQWIIASTWVLDYLITNLLRKGSTKGLESLDLQVEDFNLICEGRTTTIVAVEIIMIMIEVEEIMNFMVFQSE